MAAVADPSLAVEVLRELAAADRETLEDAQPIGERMVRLVLGACALHMAAARGVGPTGTLGARLAALAPDLSLFSPFREGLDARLEAPAEAAYARLAPLAGGALEALGSGYEGLVGARFVRAVGPSVAAASDTSVGGVLDVGLLLALRPADRAEAVAAVLGASPGARVARALLVACDAAAVVSALGRHARGPLVPPGGLVVTGSLARRRSGSHYTPADLAHLVVGRALSPVFAAADAHAAPLDLRVCDPAMGAGAFLFAAARAIASAARAPLSDVVARCLYGVDKDPVAVDVARAGAWLLAGDGASFDAIRAHLVVGDALLGAKAQAAARATDDIAALRRTLDAELALHFWPADAPAPGVDALLRAAAEGRDDDGGGTARRVAQQLGFLHVAAAFPEIARRGGFDAVVGNPPWVAYAGRAAQPLGEAERRYFTRNSRSFFGYRTLHGLFVERGAELLRAGGRLGLVVPTSVADLAGYAPVRAAHDRLAVADDDLPDFGADAFAGVFQPAMAILSTRRPPRVEGALEAPPVDAAPWPLARGDLDAPSAALLTRLAALPPLPPGMFGERGIQTSGSDSGHLHELRAMTSAECLPVREGKDVAPFAAHPPRLALDTARVGARIPSAAAFSAVALLVRQTARFPMAALGDGGAFRNSVLAAFAHDALETPALLALLNATPTRWLHFVRHRDARQGMPQLKIAHLRATPLPPALSTVREALCRLGAELGQRNSGVTDREQAQLDDLVAGAFLLTPAERELVRRWGAANAPPTAR